MIYHICPYFDANVKNAIDRFERIKPDFNRCIVLYEKVPPATNMKINDKNGYIFLACSYKNSDWLESLKKDCTGLIIHNLQDYLLDPLLGLPANIQMYFRSYGGDIFDIIYNIDNEFYLSRTKEIVVKTLPLHNKFLQSLNKIYCKIIPHKRNWEKIREKKILLLKRLFALSTSCPYEFELIRNRHPELNVKYLQLNYIPLSGSESFQKNIDKVNIMIGHSNSPGQNHIDAFELLKNMKITGSIITPLSYLNSDYTKAVIREGYRFFNGKFQPLISFVPIVEYFNILSSCYAFIEYSLYQQGLGNIVFMLRRGSNVYLSKQNPIFMYFKKQGVTIFSIEDDLSGEHLNSFRLTQFETDKNNRIIDTYNSEEVDESTVSTIINYFNNN